MFPSKVEPPIELPLGMLVQIFASRNHFNPNLTFERMAEAPKGLYGILQGPVL
jgi:hypothetical protein